MKFALKAVVVCGVKKMRQWHLKDFGDFMDINVQVQGWVDHADNGGRHRWFGCESPDWLKAGHIVDRYEA